MTVKSNSKTNEIVSLAILFLILLVASISAFITAQLNWGMALLFLFLTFLTLFVVGVCAVITIVRNAQFRYKWLIFINAILFSISINLTYSEDGIYEWHKYRFLWQTHTGQTPNWIETISNISVFTSFILALMGCSLMIAWAFSPKRK